MSEQQRMGELTSEVDLKELGLLIAEAARLATVLKEKEKLSGKAINAAHDAHNEWVASKFAMRDHINKMLGEK